MKRIIFLTLLITNLTTIIYAQKPTLKETQQWLKIKIEMYGGLNFLGTTYKVEYPDSSTMVIHEIQGNETDAIFKINMKEIEVDALTYRIKKRNGFNLLITGGCSEEAFLTLKNAKKTSIYQTGKIELNFKPSPDPNKLAQRIIKALKHYNYLLIGDLDSKF